MQRLSKQRQSSSSSSLFLAILLVLALVIAPFEIWIVRRQNQTSWQWRSSWSDTTTTTTTELLFLLDVVVTPRVYQPWNTTTTTTIRDLPCYDDVMGNPKRVRGSYNFYEQNQNTRKGFLYMRPPKCASTTVAGVNLRIARNVAQRRQQRQDHDQKAAAPMMMMCDMSYTHGGKERARRFRSRVRGQSYLWTMIREPTARHISFFWFWGVSATRGNRTDQAMQQFLLRQEPDYYFSYLSTRYNPSVSRSGTKSTMSHKDMVDEVNFILQEYDFIGITERLDESLVVLMMLLDLPMADVLYYTAKKAEHDLYRDPLARFQKCIALKKPSNVSDSMKEFFSSDTWQERVYSDTLLYQAANQSLEWTIDFLGRERVQENVAKLQYAQRFVDKECRGKVRMECEAEGEPPNKEFDCMHHDVGCGMDCIDHVATELGLW